MEEETNVRKRRPGGGRKPKRKNPTRFSVKLDEDVMQILQVQENRTDYINNAIREKFRREVRLYG